LKDIVTFWARIVSGARGLRAKDKTMKRQWLESYVAADKTFCIYLAENEALVFEHAKLGGFPVTKVTEVPTVISPMTAY
jgi:hypothetical protein